MEKKGFTQISNRIIFDRRIPDGAFRTFVALRSYKFGESGRSFPTQEKVAELLDRRRETVCRHVRDLIKLGVLRVKKRGYSTSNEYLFDSEEKITNESEGCDKNLTPTEQIHLPELSRKHHTNNTKNKTKTKNNIEILRRKMVELGLKKDYE